MCFGGRRHEFGVAIRSAGVGVLGVTVLLQIVALLARSEAWHLSIDAAAGTVARRVLCSGARRRYDMRAPDTHDRAERGP